MPGWWLLFRGGEPLCVEVPVTLVRVYLGMVTCFGARLCWGGGGNVTFPGIRLSRGIPLSLILVCTSGPQRSGMFRWSWCRVLYTWWERRTFEGPFLFRLGTLLPDPTILGKPDFRSRTLIRRRTHSELGYLPIRLKSTRSYSLNQSVHY